VRYGAVVIVVSALSDAATRNEAAAAGASGFLVKPFNAHELARVVRQAEALMKRRPDSGENR
jgi:FixJ family two-component response regulator